MLLSVELLKIRRSLALLMMFAIPLMVVVLTTLIACRQHPLAAMTPRLWMNFWGSTSALWCYFMLPLYIALVTGLLNGQEHKNQSWRLMLTLPVSQYQLYLMKALLAWLFVVGATVALAGAATLAAALMVLGGAPVDGAFGFALLPMIAKVALACLPVLAIQHALSWRFQNLVLPLAVGVVATMGITQIGSAREWVYYPWTYAVMAVNGGQAGSQQTALLLAALLGTLLLAASTMLLGRREVES